MSRSHSTLAAVAKAAAAAASPPAPRQLRAAVPPGRVVAGLPDGRRRLLHYFVEQGGYHSGHVSATLQQRSPLWRPTVQMLGRQQVWLAAAPVSFVWAKKQHVCDYRQHAVQLAVEWGDYSWHYPLSYVPPSVEAVAAKGTALRRALALGMGLPVMRAFPQPAVAAHAVAAAAAAAAAATASGRRERRGGSGGAAARALAAAAAAAAAARLAECGVWGVRERHPPRNLRPCLPPSPVLIGCFEDCSALTFKHKLYLNLARYCQDRPVAGSLRSRTPHTFLYCARLGPAADVALATWADEMKLDPRTSGVWIAKGTASANGTGVVVARDPAAVTAGIVRSRQQRADKHPAQPPAAQTAAEAAAQLQRDHWVVQEFVDPSPLLRRRRFSIRLFALAVGTVGGLDVWVWRRGNIATCLTDCRPGPDCPDLAAAITNFRAQKSALGSEYEGMKSQHFMSFDDACAELPALRGVWPRAVEITIECFAACLGRTDFCFCPGAFEVFGFDFIVERLPDGSLNPLVLEANLRPGYATNRSVLETLIGDSVQVVLDAAYPERPRTDGDAAARRDRYTKVASFLSADFR